jgi:hypothetical protein
VSATQYRTTGKSMSRVVINNILGGRGEREEKINRSVYSRRVLRGGRVIDHVKNTDSP